MERTVYLDGQFIKESEAKVSIFDRGFLFGDAVYEVTAVLNGLLVENEGHMLRLQRSCDELQIALPVTIEQIIAIQRELIKVNQLDEGGIYLQVSRGNAGDRDFAYPSADVKPTLVLFTQARSLLNTPKATKGMKVITTEDIRWKRRDIKTVGLLAPCMAKQGALDKQVDDAWLIEDGYITEGSSNNAYIVTQEGVLITRALSNDILHGITRKALLELAEKENMKIEERSFTVEEAYQASEAFVSSATTFVWPVIEIDGKTIADGKPGSVATKLRNIYIELALQTAE
ncbi:D-amino-acid transaminase [Psychromonas sp. RZ22]|uniref:D-amino-acid transaminase n=1 Tax=Psychromonas algarum TaxID=2555643 RepID=UPI001068853E|nr:D-amino-acid transaminase [Psychromonas sp. RZ22]TEW54712.1 D-amino-acid transaminase [Psychromonas sp. RZ22]